MRYSSPELGLRMVVLFFVLLQILSREIEGNLPNLSHEWRLAKLRAVEDWIAKTEDAEVSAVMVQSEESKDEVGLYLARDLRPGERAVTIPRSLCLTARDAPSWAMEAEVPLGARVASRLLAERRKGGVSRFYVWLSSLPAYLDAPVAWTESEAGLLKGSRAFRARRDIRDEWRTEARILNLKAEPRINYEAEYVWARLVVASRSYELPENLGPVLAPWLDLANHDDDCFLALDVDRGPSSGVIFALVNEGEMKKRGQPITTNYCGGRPMDPVKGLDIFGWLVNDSADFCRIRSHLYRVGDPLDAILTELSPTTIINEANRLIRLLDDARHQRDQAEHDLLLAEAESTSAAARKKRSSSSALTSPLAHRIQLAKKIVQGERRALLALIHALQQEQHHHYQPSPTPFVGRSAAASSSSLSSNSHEYFEL